MRLKLQSAKWSVPAASASASASNCKNILIDCNTHHIGKKTLRLEQNSRHHQHHVLVNWYANISPKKGKNLRSGRLQADQGWQGGSGLFYFFSLFFPMSSPLNPNEKKKKKIGQRKTRRHVMANCRPCLRCRCHQHLKFFPGSKLANHHDHITITSHTHNSQTSAKGPN